MCGCADVYMQHACTHARMHACTAWARACMQHACKYACMDVCMCICACLCVFMHVCVWACMHVSMHARMPSCRIYTHNCMDAYVVWRYVIIFERLNTNIYVQISRGCINAGIWPPNRCMLYDRCMWTAGPSAPATTAACPTGPQLSRQEAELCHSYPCLCPSQFVEQSCLTK